MKKQTILGVVCAALALTAMAGQAEQSQTSPYCAQAFNYLTLPTQRVFENWCTTKQQEGYFSSWPDCRARGWVSFKPDYVAAATQMLSACPATPLPAYNLWILSPLVPR